MGNILICTLACLLVNCCYGNKALQHLLRIFTKSIKFAIAILDPIFSNSLKNILKIDYNLNVPSTTSRISRFPFHISLYSRVALQYKTSVLMIGMGLNSSLLFDVLIKYF